MILLCNPLGENYSTGKTVIASSLVARCLKDGAYNHIIWIQDPAISSSNVELFYQYLIKRLKNLHSLTFHFPDSHQIRAQSSHHYENLLLDLLAMNKDIRCLLVVDNLTDFSILSAIRTLGISTLLTSRLRPTPLFDGTVVEVSRFDEAGLDILTPKPQRFSPPEGSLFSAYLLGANRREPNPHSPVKTLSTVEPLYEPTLPLLLHTHLHCCLSPLAARLFSTLRYLPANIFAPAQLVFFVWSSWLRDGLKPEAVLKELADLSLLQTTPSGGSLSITTDSRAVLEAFCLPDHLSQKNDRHAELPPLAEVTQRLSTALCTISGYLSVGLEDHPSCVIPLFDYLGWSSSDLIRWYSPLMETLLSGVPTGLSQADRFLRSLFEAFDDIHLQHHLSEIGSLGSRERVLFCIVGWSRSLVERIDLLSSGLVGADLRCDRRAVLMFHATVCELCHLGDEAVATRKRVFEYQRSLSPKLTLSLGVSLLSLGRAIFAAHSSGTGGLYGRGEETVDAVLESVARMAVKSLAQIDTNSSLGDCSLVFLVDVLELIGVGQGEAMGILETVLKLRNKLHETLLHPRISAIYCRLSQIQFREQLWDDALQSLHKAIRINRTIFGDAHHFVSDLKERLSDYHAALGQQNAVQELFDSSNYSRSPLNLRHLKSLSPRKSSPSRKRVAEGGEGSASLDDIALLIALADKIAKKGDLHKARKYLVKALRLISEMMSVSEEPFEPTDPTLPLVFKWSTYHKLGDLNEREGEPIRAIKFYQRAYKGFLELGVLDAERRLQHLAEAVTVGFNLASLTESVKGFSDAFPLYLELLMVLADLYLSQTRLGRSPESHLHIIEHLRSALLRHQQELSNLLNQIPKTLYQSPHNLFELSSLTTHLNKSGQELLKRFLSLSEEICQLILPPPLSPPHHPSASSPMLQEALISETNEMNTPTLELPGRFSDEDSLEDIPPPALPPRVSVPLPPKPPIRSAKRIEASPSAESFEPISTPLPLREASPVLSPVRSPLPVSHRRRGRRAIHFLPNDVETVELLLPIDQGVTQEDDSNHASASVIQDSTPTPLSLGVKVPDDIITERESPLPSPDPLRGSPLHLDAAPQSVEEQLSDPFESPSPKVEAAPRQPRLSRQVSIKEIQEECTKFVNFFVFGSLRRHQENHPLLSMPNRDESFSYVGTTATVSKLFLYINGATGLPIVTEEAISGVKSTTTTIVGEVYSVTPSIVERAGALFPDSALVNIDLESFSKNNHEGNAAVMYLAMEPSDSEWINIPRGNYSQFLAARGGIRAFLTQSSKINQRKSINTTDLAKLTEAFNERKEPKERRKFKIWD
jgi:tetratricopeptide (TPR) repeat protein/gamma-glutamylcyclotransferase (GGCT)/AIG2-like uncharacterized protein YtfP